MIPIQPKHTRHCDIVHRNEDNPENDFYSDSCVFISKKSCLTGFHKICPLYFDPDKVPFKVSRIGRVISNPATDKDYTTVLVYPYGFTEVYNVLCAQNHGKLIRSFLYMVSSTLLPIKVEISPAFVNPDDNTLRLPLPERTEDADSNEEVILPCILNKL